MEPVLETVFVTSPLDAASVTRLRASAPEGVEIVYEADLLPPTRYTADHKGDPGFRRSNAEDERWRANLARATILWDFPPVTDLTAGGLTLAPNVRWVQTTSSGVGQYVKKLGLGDSDIFITTASGVHARPLAEFAIMAFLMYRKGLDRLRQEQAAHRWDRYCGKELLGCKMTVVGAGKVGTEVGRLAKAFGIRVTAVVNHPSLERQAALGVDEIVGPDQLSSAVADADWITVCTPHTVATEGMIDRGIIAAMKNDVVLVNVSRGQVIDEKALIAALRSGHIGFAALDVAAVEPLPPESPLWDLPNVLISPHSASTVERENDRVVDIFIKNMHFYVAKQKQKMINVFERTKMY